MAGGWAMEVAEFARVYAAFRAFHTCFARPLAAGNGVSILRTICAPRWSSPRSASQYQVAAPMVNCDTWLIREDRGPQSPCGSWRGKAHPGPNGLAGDRPAG